MKSLTIHKTDINIVMSYAKIHINIIRLIILIYIALAFSLNIFSRENVTIKVGVYENEPKIFTKSGKPSGIFIDVLEEIAGLEGWSIEYIPGTWDEDLERLKKGEIDLMPDVAYTSERERDFSFHQVPVLSSWSQVFARPGSGIQSILDLNGKKVAVLDGSVQQKAFEGLAKGFGLKFTISPYESFDKAFEAVKQGKADAVISNNFYGLVHAKKIGLEDTAVVFNPSALFFAATKYHNRDVLMALDKHLTRLKQNPKSIYYTSIKHWTSEKVSLIIPFWLRIVALCAVIALIMSIIAWIILKIQVDRKTKELRDSNREMEDRIIERTWALEEAMEHAKDADRIKSSFLATMSHELRTPLNSIIGFTGILLQQLPGPLTEEQTKQLRMVQNSSRHLLSLINDVLDISKIEAGQLDLQFSVFDLTKSIDKVVSLVQPLINSKHIELIIFNDDEVKFVYLDQRRIEQIILNLLSNAIKFTEIGKITLTIKMENNNYIISVQDTGIGIRESDLAGLFKPFSQADNGLSRKYEGTGLGLSICKKLIEMMHGQISVQSEYGKGSIFTIYFPVHEEGDNEQKNSDH